MKVNEKLSLLVLPKSARKSKDGSLSLDIRITVNLKRAVISLGQKVPASLWDQEAGKMKGSTQEARLLNNAIEQCKVKVRRLYQSLELQGEEVTVEMLWDAYQGKMEQPKTLLNAIDFVIERFEKKVEKQHRSVASLKKLRTIRAKTVNFIRHQYKAKDIRLDKIRFAFAEDFVDYLMLDEDINANTAKKYLKHVKHAIKTGVERNWIPTNPIQTYKCGYIDPERDILTEQEIMILYHKHFEIKRLEEIKDTYLFMCFTGFAYKDTSLLTTDHIIDFFDGQQWVVKNRHKVTSTICRESVPLLPIAKEIIEKYNNHHVRKSQGLLLPVLSNQKYNAYLKEVVTICGINKTLTTHTARHTFATTVTLANGVPIETVSALLGHKSVKTTQIYAKIVAQKISEDMSTLKQKLAIKLPNLTLESHGNQSIITDIKTIIRNSRDTAIRAVDIERVRMYWRIGQRIFVEEQQEKDRADYGAQLLKTISTQLQPEFGSGLSIRQLKRYRQFYRTFPIASALRTQLGWTHYKMLISIDNQDKRDFYIAEAVKNNWSSRQLERQIHSSFWERLLMSNDRNGILAVARNEQQPSDAKDIIKTLCISNF